MTESDLLDKFLNVKVHKAGGKASVHKPVLILLALREFQKGNFELYYEEFEKELSELIKKVGLVKSPKPYYPFVRLSHDRIWQLSNQTIIDQHPGEDPPGKFLKENKISGSFSNDVLDSLKTRNQFVVSLTQSIKTKFLSAPQIQIVENIM